MGEHMVTVEIVDVISGLAPPTTAVTYEVRNTGSAPVWLVDDGWLVWRQAENRIELSFARATMRPDAQPVGYFDPDVAEIPPGSALRRRASLQWPQKLSTLWNAEPYAAPAPGRHSLSVSVGYGLTPEPSELADDPDVEGDVLRWQRVVASTPVTAVVPDYQVPWRAGGVPAGAKPGDDGSRRSAP